MRGRRGDREGGKGNAGLVRRKTGSEGMVREKGERKEMGGKGESIGVRKDAIK